MCSPLIVVFNTARQRCAKYQKQSAHLLGSPVLRHRQSAVNVRSGYLIQPCTSVDIDNTMVVLSTQVPLSTTLSFSLFSTRHAVYDTAQERIRTFVSKQKGFRDKPGTLKADKARFELAEAFTSHAFEACSLDRSDTYPCCQNGNLFIMPHSADLANRSFAELDSAWDNAILCEIAMGQTMSRLTVRIGQLRKSEFFNYQNPNIGGGRSGDGATLH